MNQLEKGTLVTLNTKGDVLIDPVAKRFFGLDLVVVRTAKSGLIEVHVDGYPDQIARFRKRNLDLIGDKK